MSEQELRAKAQRAAEWWNNQDNLYPVSEHSGWWVCQTEFGRLEWPDEQMIVEADIQGWQDSQLPAVDNADDNTQELTDHIVEPNKMDEDDRAALLLLRHPDYDVSWSNGEWGVYLRSNEPNDASEPWAWISNSPAEEARNLGWEG